MWKRGKKEKTYRGKPGERAYAIGDVHGCYDQLIEILRKIDAHNQSSPQKPAHIVFLGDLIDRGPNSRLVLEHLIQRSEKDQNMHFVKGNHEEAMLRGLRGEPDLLEPWLRHGGFETAASYSIRRETLIGRPNAELEHLLISAISRRHLKFVETFSDSIRFGDYLFVHAGVRPGTALELQSPRDMRWIREPFLKSAADFGFKVIHGHTRTEHIEQMPNRIGIDTGAYLGGSLSAVWIDEDQVGFLQTET